MTDGNIRLNTLNSVAEYYQEGTKQHICVGTAKYYLKADTLVLRATLGGKTIATFEISLKDYSILQCRAFDNGICEYTEQIASIINANKKMIAERKRAKVQHDCLQKFGGYLFKFAPDGSHENVRRVSLFLRILR